MTRHSWLAGALAALVLSGCRQSPPGAGEEMPPTEVAVTVTPVVRATLHEYVDGWGRVEPEPASRGRTAANARLTSPVPGLVSRILVSEGQEIAAGALLIELDTRVADLAIERARQAIRVAEQVVLRQEQLGPGEATSQKAYQEALAQRAAAQAEMATAELQRRLLEVHAPIAGTVVALTARLGDAIDPTTVLGEVVDLHRLTVSAFIRSVDAPRVSRGQRMELFTSEAGPRQANTGSPAGVATVDFVGPRVDASSDTVVVRARPAETSLRPGQFLHLRILVGERADRLAVPIESILQDAAGRAEVALIQGATATRTAVTTGIRDGGLVEVTGTGLHEGASVVVTGAYGLPATSAVKVTTP